MPDITPPPSPRVDTPAMPVGLADAPGRHRRLRQLLAGGDLFLAPGAFDCVGARLVEAAGFPALYVTGSGISMSAMGAPDVGALSFGEILDRVRRICDVVSIPVIADGDTGYGGPLNVIRTVREYERAGVSAIQIEDQEWPKKCGHEPGRVIAPVETMVMRIRAAIEARRDPDFAVIARTDARAGEGLAAAIERARAYRAAGADVIFVESPQSEAELAEIGRAFPGVPLLANMVEGGKTPILPAERLHALGFRLAIYPNALTRLFAKAGLEMLASLKETGSTNAMAPRMLSHGELWTLFDNATWRALEDRYLRVEAR
ncbi:isocitrate lyase/PEP mutase family protein [Falsiroseomonas sp. CW058]|uniref:isocitrate lyase/PEP mutase family protein n=1 Tax=Falsiroseomonas sp. CW058 TaxID=3388664 RepID=UPI003D3224C4